MRTTKLSDRYQTEEKLASGGMGAVFRARDERLHRDVAVKLLRDELVDEPRFVERFRREARAVAALSHPNVAAVFDYGEDEHHFIVMELVEGRDLARVIREEGPLLPERAARIAASVCDALQHAHSAGVVHRDIKPANIILTADDSVKVTDFGIARAAGDSTLTATGSMLGTAHYLSPEQASGTPAGPASDLYSLGIVLFEMLTGTQPFGGESPVAVAMAHVSDEVPRPSSVKAGVPPALDAVVGRATAKEPVQRFQDAASMAHALRAVTATESGEPHLTAAADAAETAGSTDEFGSTGSVWPIPGERWDPHKLGRAVLLTIGGLMVAALALLAWRVVDGGEPEEPPAAQTAADGGAGTTAQPNQEENLITLGDYEGQLVKDVEKVLKEMELVVVKQPQDSAADKDVIIRQTPEAGTAMSPGDTVTLIVSTGHDADDDEGPGNSGHGPKEPPPGHEKEKDD